MALVFETADRAKWRVTFDTPLKTALIIRKSTWQSQQPIRGEPKFTRSWCELKFKTSKLPEAGENENNQDPSTPTFLTNHWANIKTETTLTKLSVWHSIVKWSLKYKRTNDRAGLLHVTKNIHLIRTNSTISQPDKKKHVKLAGNGKKKMLKRRA